MNRIHADFDQALYQVVDAATAMVDDFHTVIVRLIDKKPNSGKDKLAKVFRPDHRPRLTPKIVPQENRVEHSPRRLKDDLIRGEVEFHNPVDYGPKHLRSLKHRYQSRLHSECGAGVLKVGRPEDAHLGVVVRDGGHRFAAPRRVDVLRRIRPEEVVDCRRIRLPAEKPRRCQRPVLVVDAVLEREIERACNVIRRRAVVRYVDRPDVISQAAFELFNRLHAEILEQSRQGVLCRHSEPSGRSINVSALDSR